MGPCSIRGAQGKLPISSSVSRGSCQLNPERASLCCVSTGLPDLGTRHWNINFTQYWLTMCHSGKSGASASPSSSSAGLCNCCRSMIYPNLELA